MSQSDSTHILVIDDERSMREMISILLKRHSYRVTTANSATDAARHFNKGEQFDLVITDLLMDNGGGIEVIEEVKKRDLPCEVIVITAFGTAESAVEAMKKGAFDYVTKPFNVDEFIIIIRQALERRALIQENIDLRARVRGEYKFADIVGRSQAMKEVISFARKVADSTATVLISGESGTGKEVVARAIHFASARSDDPFIAVNCGALPEQLMESELFGHLKGSFTGATANQEGLFRAAGCGTIFLDEIGELPPPLQVKMLRVLQERMVRPVGATAETTVEARVIAATNQNLEKMVKENRFRKDLYYRLNVIHTEVPPLRKRREDIPLLVDHFLNRISSEHGTTTKRVTNNALKALSGYSYPGNVRELANILERTVTLASSDEIDGDDLPAEINKWASSTASEFPVLPEEGCDLEMVLKKLEQDLLNQALMRTGGVRTRAASLLGISFRSLRYRLSKLGLAEDEDAQE
jgi:two-component system response regulator PilR (NtrC family)